MTRIAFGQKESYTMKTIDNCIANLFASVAAAVVAAAASQPFAQTVSLERAGFECTDYRANHSKHETGRGSVVSLCWGQDDLGDYEEVYYYPAGSDRALYHSRYI